jgi:hypothetical protein
MRPPAPRRAPVDPVLHRERSAVTAGGCRDLRNYNYRHFLQLVAIKIRQREGATLDAIKKEMGDATGDALERRVATSLAAALGATIETRRGGAVGEEDNPASWRRMPVADGVELHVRDNSPASRDEALVAMREAVRAALGREDIR